MLQFSAICEELSDPISNATSTHVIISSGNYYYSDFLRDGIKLPQSPFTTRIQTYNSCNRVICLIRWKTSNFLSQFTIQPAAIAIRNRK